MKDSNLKRKHDQHPERSLNCNECESMKLDPVALERHKTVQHTKDTVIPKKLKSNENIKYEIFDTT